MLIERRWAMPSKDTFNIKPINELLTEIIGDDRLDMFQDNVDKANQVIVDPFCGYSPFKSLCTSNDINPMIPADYHDDALSFLQTIVDDTADIVLFDPPYSVRQVSEHYKAAGRTVNMETTQARFWGDLKKEIARITKKDGIVVSFGWNSGGIGKTLGFEIQRILLVAHGGPHNDTIVTVEKKIC